MNVYVPKDTPDNETFKELKKKCNEIVLKDHDKLFKGFELMGVVTRSQQRLISKENFQKVLEQYNVGFTSSEVDLILDHLVTLHSDGYVFYDKFLKDFNQKEVAPGLNDSRLSSTSRGSKKVIAGDKNR